MDSQTRKLVSRRRRRLHVRKRVRGTPERPRLSVYRSSKHIYCQIIDDSRGCTLAAASSLSAEFAKELSYGGNKTAAKVVGRLIAQKAVAAGIKKVVFDRGPCKYHGRVQAVADSAREAGLEF